MGMNYGKVCMLILVCVLLLGGCDSGDKGAAGGTLTIYYELNKPEIIVIVPSYQTVVWLENENGGHVKTLFISDYLSYGGYSKSEICSDWSQIEDWDKVGRDVLDAVTAATPAVGQNVLKIKLKTYNLPSGVYRYCVQTHVIEGYNILYRGQIRIGEKNDASSAKVTYTPGKYPKAGDVLGNVKAEYHRSWF